MSCVGIVAEYNPFHNGHRYHLSEAKRVTGAEHAIVVMSGSFVQRGEPAVADKFTRAEWALKNGADMVIELQEVFSCACAERFASGAVRLLAATGLVDSLCFGSETGNIDKLSKVSSAEIDRAQLDEALSSGLSFPKAMARASDAPLAPNDILGVEYLRAIRKFAPHIKPYAVKRIGGGYAEAELCGEYSSASAVRNALKTAADVQRMSPAVFDGLLAALPKDVLDDLAAMLKEGVVPASDTRLSDVILYRMRCMSAEEIAALPEVSEGLENLFVRHSTAHGDYSRMLAGVKSKRYTMARLKRISMCALLGISEQLQRSAFKDDSCLYLRVLGIKKSSEKLLSLLSEKSKAPVVIAAADREKLCVKACEVMDAASRANSIHALARPYDNRAIEDISHRLIIV